MLFTVQIEHCNLNSLKHVYSKNKLILIPRTDKHGVLQLFYSLNICYCFEYYVATVIHL